MVDYGMTLSWNTKITPEALSSSSQLCGSGINQVITLMIIKSYFAYETAHERLEPLKQ